MSITQIKTNSFDVQVGNQKREFTYLATIRGKDSKWVGRELKNDWVYIFRYIDDRSLFGIHLGFNNEFISKLPHNQADQLLTKM